MKPIVSSLAVAALLGMAHAAMAQQGGAAGGPDYCRTLARAYLSQNSVQASPNVSDAMLADNCATDAQGTTAILKQKLADHGIDMPQPPTVASGTGAGHTVQ